MMKIIALIISIALWFTSGQAANLQPAPRAEIQQAAGPVLVDGRKWVYSEIRVINDSDGPMWLADVKVRTSHRSVPFVKAVKAVEREIKAGTSTVIYLEIRLPASQKIKQLDYHIGYRDHLKRHQKITVVKAFHDRMPIVLDAPLNGKYWAAVYDPEWQSGHRRVYFSIAGKQYLPGRFAIDFVRLNSNGRFANDQADTIANRYGYNAEVLAVSDGVVASASGTFTESKTLSAHPDHAPDKASGNYISLKIRDGVYAFYEHLKPESIMVTPGDYVKAGQVIARLGFTGQSTGPHLHFHLADRDALLGAEGIPFGFKQFRNVGRYENFDDFGKRLWHGNGTGDSTAVQSGRPGSNTVIEFMD